MQLVAYGAQDIYLTGNPSITHFKTVYRRHTNFALECIEQIFDNRTTFGTRLTCTLSRNGDLIHEIHLQLILPDVAVVPGEFTRWTDNVGHFIIESVSLEIGGKMIDRHYGDWLEIWSQLKGQTEGYLRMIGQDRLKSDDKPTGLQANAAKGREIFVPLQFWFCRNVGLSLPIIALQYHVVSIGLTISTLEAVLITTDTYGNLLPNPDLVTDLQASLWVDYIYLDTEERWRFAQVSHEYLIDQLQYYGGISYAAGTKDRNIPLEFNQPVKELVWTVRNAALANYKQWANYTDTLASAKPGTPVLMTNPYASQNPVNSAKLILNGIDRFAQRSGNYFNTIQTYSAHTIPISPGINVYSFALKPEEHQPTGTCNFSRLDSAVLALRLTPDKVPDNTGPTLIAATLGLTSLFSSAGLPPLITYVNAQTSTASSSIPEQGPLLTLSMVASYNAWLTGARSRLASWNRHHPAAPDRLTGTYINAIQTYLTAVISTDFLMQTMRFYILTKIQPPEINLANYYVTEYLEINKTASIQHAAYIQGIFQTLTEAYAHIATNIRNESDQAQKAVDLLLTAVAMMKSIMYHDLESYASVPGYTALWQPAFSNTLSTIKAMVEYIRSTLNDYTYANSSANYALAPYDNTVDIYAVNYNVLRISSGMGGLAYSN